MVPYAIAKLNLRSEWSHLTSLKDTKCKADHTNSAIQKDYYTFGVLVINIKYDTKSTNFLTLLFKRTIKHNLCIVYHMQNYAQSNVKSILQ